MDSSTRSVTLYSFAFFFAIAALVYIIDSLASTAPKPQLIRSHQASAAPFALHDRNTACLAAAADRIAPMNLSAAANAPRDTVVRPVAIVIPLGPRSYRPEQGHWEYVADFTSATSRSAETLGFDIFVVLSGATTIAEFAAFANERARTVGRPSPRFRTLDFNDWMSDSEAFNFGAPGGTGVIISAKVFFALASLHTCYEFIVRIDAEVEFLRPDLLVDHVRAFMAAGRVFINSGLPSSEMLEQAARFFPAEERSRWRSISEDYTIFSHFNALPVYDTKDVPAFFTLMRVDETPPYFPATTYVTWEFQTYVILKILRGEWHFFDINRELSLQPFYLESLSDFDTFRRISLAAPPGPLWARAGICGMESCACATLPEAVAPVMLFHLNYPMSVMPCPEET